jgi:hypothetical protein
MSGFKYFKIQRLYTRESGPWTLCKSNPLVRFVICVQWKVNDIQHAIAGLSTDPVHREGTPLHIAWHNGRKSLDGLIHRGLILVMGSIKSMPLPASPHFICLFPIAFPRPPHGIPSVAQSFNSLLFLLCTFSPEIELHKCHHLLCKGHHQLAGQRSSSP